MSQTIYEKIQSKGDVAINDILAKAKIESNQIRESILSKAKRDSEIRLKKAKDDALKSVNYKRRLFDLEKRQSTLTTKQEIIDDIFNKVLSEILKLEGSELLSYITKLIKEESLVGDEIIKVNKNDYNKFLKALSTSKKGELVEVDLLNSELKTNFKLSSEPIEIDNGFILVGKYFDINFTFTQIIANLRKNKEKTIADTLFE